MIPDISKKFIITLVSIFALSVFLSGKTAAQGGTMGSFSRIGLTPSGVAMGNATLATVNLPGNSLYNPAQSAILFDQIPVTVSSALLPFDRQLNTASAHFTLPPSAGLSLSILHARTGEIDGRDLNGYHTGYFSSNEYRLNGAFGIRFTDHLFAGIGMNFIYSNLHPEVTPGRYISFDIGALYSQSEYLTAGFSVLNLLANRSLNSSDLYGTESGSTTDREPLRVLTGLTINPRQNITISSELEYRYQYFERSTRTSFAGEPVTDGDWYVRLGLGYELHERLTIRGGIRYHRQNADKQLQPSTGFSLHLPFDSMKPSLDYAFASEPSGFSSFHMIGMRINL